MSLLLRAARGGIGRSSPLGKKLEGKERKSNNFPSHLFSLCQRCQLQTKKCSLQIYLALTGVPLPLRSFTRSLCIP